MLPGRWPSSTLYLNSQLFPQHLCHVGVEHLPEYILWGEDDVKRDLNHIADVSVTRICSPCVPGFCYRQGGDVRWGTQFRMMMGATAAWNHASWFGTWWDWTRFGRPRIDTSTLQMSQVTFSLHHLRPLALFLLFLSLHRNGYELVMYILNKCSTTES